MGKNIYIFAIFDIYFLNFDTIITARIEITNADRRGVTISLESGQTVNNVPKISPANTPCFLIFFHHKDNTKAGPKAEPSHPQA